MTTKDTDVPGPHAGKPLESHHIGHDGREVRDRGVNHRVGNRQNRVALGGLGSPPLQPFHGAQTVAGIVL